MNPRSSKSPQAYISTRKYIKWGDNPAGENTDTLVLTTPQKHYVDVRIYLPTSTSNSNPNPTSDPSAPAISSPSTTTTTLPISRVEWAFAGTSTSTLPTATTPQHSTWTHWVDSKHALGTEVQDAGDMYPQADGSTLEYGMMVNPASGVEEKYEESWCDIDPLVVGSVNKGGKEEEQRKRGWVLQTSAGEEGEEVRGIVARVGQYIQGVLKKGEDVNVERWRFDVEQGKWILLVRVGEGLGLDVDALVRAQSHFKVQDHSAGKGKSALLWVCKEVFEWE